MASPSCRVGFALVVFSVQICALPQTTWATNGNPSIKIDDDVTLCIKGAIQPRLRYDRTKPEDGDNEHRTRMFIRRARLGLCGSGPWSGLDWKLQVAWDRGQASLKDAQLDFTAVPDTLVIRAGQMKRPFSRQFLNSGLKQALMDRSLTHTVFKPGRGIGVMLHNGFEASPQLEWASGLFNGTGDKASFRPSFDDTGNVSNGTFSHEPPTAHPMWVGRVGYNHNGMKGYSEGDLEGGPLRFAVAASAVADFDGALAKNEATNLGLDTEIDAALKVHGFALSGAGYITTSEPEGSRTIEAAGAHGQASYVVGGRYQPAVRYAWVDKRADALKLQEMTAAFSLYLKGHQVKWVTDSSLIFTNPSATMDVVMRSQVQVAF